MLSNLFENLIVTTEAEGTVVRMPGATYYTPHDIAREMTVDALAEAVRDEKPPEWTEEEWLGLFRGGDWTERSCPGLPDRLRRLRVSGLRLGRVSVRCHAVPATSDRKVGRLGSELASRRGCGATASAGNAADRTDPRARHAPDGGPDRAPAAFRRYRRGGRNGGFRPPLAES